MHLMDITPSDLRAARAVLAMTQKQLADAIGVSRATINRAENNDRVRPVIALAVQGLVNAIKGEQTA